MDRPKRHRFQDHNIDDVGSRLLEPVVSYTVAHAPSTKTQGGVAVTTEQSGAGKDGERRRQRRGGQARLWHGHLRRNGRRGSRRAPIGAPPRPAGSRSRWPRVASDPSRRRQQDQACPSHPPGVRCRPPMLRRELRARARRESSSGCVF